MWGILKRLLFQKADSLQPHERLCCEEWFATLPQGTREIAHEQFSAVTGVLRHLEGRVVSLKYNRGALPEFNLMESEAYVSVLTVGDDRGAADSKCYICISHGILSGLLFDTPPKAYIDSGPTVKKVENLFDPMVQWQQVELESPPSALQEALRRASTESLTQVLSAATEQAVENHFILQSAPVSQDHKELLTITDGFRLGNLRFYGTRFRKLPVRNATYNVLAESISEDTAEDPICVCTLEGASTPEYFLYNSVDEEIVFKDSQLVPAIIEAAKRV